MYIIIGKPECPYCVKAVQILEENHVDYVYYCTHSDSPVFNEFWQFDFKDTLRASTLPVVLKVVGGSTEIEEQLRNDGVLI